MPNPHIVRSDNQRSLEDCLLLWRQQTANQWGDQVHGAAELNGQAAALSATGLDLLPPGLGAFVYHYPSATYSIMSTSCGPLLGYSLDPFLQEGAAYAAQYIHPQDLREWFELEFRVYNHFRQLSPAQRSQLRYEHTYRFLHSNGRYIWLHQSSMPLEIDEQGVLVSSVSTIMDVSPLMQPGDRFSWQISLKASGEGKTRILSGPRPTNRGGLQITPREREILNLMMQGYNSRQIAEELHISPYTAGTHRKNLLQKTGSRNTAELIRQAVDLQLA